MISIKYFGADPSKADNSDAIQRAIDFCMRSKYELEIPIGTYKVGKPLMVVTYDDAQGYYRQSTIVMRGYSTMWDKGDRSVLEATFKDGPLLGLHINKGSIIEGITFKGKYVPPVLTDAEFYRAKFENYGDPTCRDSALSPYTAIAIEPVCASPGWDGGYPPLKDYYKGYSTNSGSTGLFIRNCTFNGFVVGAITSPSGYTSNAEIITFENIRITDCKVGIAGCQPQEKMNRIINVGAWGQTHTLFQFSHYGSEMGGHWIIDGVNVAGRVNRLVSKKSGARFPLHMRNVFAESLGQIGEWQSGVGDALTDFSINFKRPHEIGILPDAHLTGGGVRFSNGTLRNYGYNYPVLFTAENNNPFIMDNVDMTREMGPNVSFCNAFMQQPLPPQLSWGWQNVDIVREGNTVTVPFSLKAVSGKMAIFYSITPLKIIGQGLIDTVGEVVTIKWVSESVTAGKYYIGIFK